MVIKKSQTTSKSPAKTAKSSVKKNATGNKTKIVKKAVIKKPVKAVKAAGTKLAGIKTAAKPEAKKSGSEIKKPIKTIEVQKTKKIAAKKPDRTSAATAKGKKALPKVPKKIISVSKSEAQGKKPLKKSPAKIVSAKPGTTQKKTFKPLSTKKPGKVVAAKAGGKTAKGIKVPAKTVSTAKAEKKPTVKTAEAKATPKKTIKPVSTKKPSVQKAGKVVAAKAEGKTAKGIKAPAKTVSTAKTEKKSVVKKGLQKKPASSSTIPQIKKTVQQKTVLKPEEKTEAPLSTIRKTVKKKVAPSLIAEEPLPAISKKTTATYTPKAETKPKKVTKLKVFLPEEELPPEEIQQAPAPQLPQEYGENELLLMEVDPSVVFVSWEIKPEDISGEAGKLALRVYDVTGIDFDGTNSNSFFDISLRNRADSKFIDIKMPGKDVIMDIGLLEPEGTFKTIKRSNRISMPALQTFDELDIAGSLSDSETLIGY